MSRFVIFVAGPPATGKTSLCTKLAKKYKLPILSKDSLKEVLFDELGIKDRQWSRSLGAASMALISNLSLQLATSEQNFIIESNFRHESFRQLVNLIRNENDYKVLIINLYCTTDVLLDRFEIRYNSGLRHVGHFDGDTLRELRANLELFGNTFLEDGDIVFKIDTTDSFDFEEVEKCLDQLI